jgi:hypothetical protein
VGPFRNNPNSAVRTKASTIVSTWSDFLKGAAPARLRVSSKSELESIRKKYRKLWTEELMEASAKLDRPAEKQGPQYRVGDRSRNC